jgi:protein gp37
MNKTNIEMFPGDYQWNPLRKPCTRDCKNPLGESYCWTQRFKRNPNLPEWDEKELVAPFHRKKGTDILVCWMTDLMLTGNYEQIQSILDVCNTSPQHRFFFLTKSPLRYLDFEFPRNCWLGITVTHEKDLISYISFFVDYEPQKENRFISFEPLYENIITNDKAWWKFIQWIFVGCETIGNVHTPNLKTLPKKEWLLKIRKITREYGIKLWEKYVLRTTGLLEKPIQERPL